MKLNKINLRIFPNKASKCSSSLATWGIKNLHKVDEFLYRGANPDLPSGVTKIKELGITKVICFKTEDFMFEEFLLNESGIKFFRIPFSCNNLPTSEQIDAFFEIIEKARANNEKVLIHCTEGKDRTGLFAAMYKLKYGLDTLDNCIREMLMLGHDERINRDAIPFLKEYASQLKNNN